MEKVNKFTIFQVLPRLWGRGKFSDWDRKTFDYIKWLGVSAVWYTGVLRHARGKAFVKGEPGSPYAITDYYDVNPYLADDEAERMAEFEALIHRTHEAGLKVIMDFVPNHVARDYHSYCAPEGVRDLGADDDTSVHWRPDNDFFYYPGIPFKLPDGIDGWRQRAKLPAPEAYEENPAKVSKVANKAVRTMAAARPLRTASRAAPARKPIPTSSRHSPNSARCTT